MSEKARQYVAIDAKSFYASVECVERHLNPLTTNLVVADESRTEKTICLAVSPALKAHKIPGRPRLFEVIQRIREVNRERLKRSGLVIYLRANVDDLYLRTCHDKSRPLLQTANPKAKLQELYEIRDPLYREVADLVIDTSSQSVHQLINRLQKELEQHFHANRPA
mgnify:CR=1 FL=1